MPAVGASAGCAGTAAVASVPVLESILESALAAEVGPELFVALAA